MRKNTSGAVVFNMANIFSIHSFEPVLVHSLCSQKAYVYKHQNRKTEPGC